MSLKFAQRLLFFTNFIVLRFICNNTIEGQILQKQREKLGIAESALTGVMNAAVSELTMTMKDYYKMFGMDEF